MTILLKHSILIASTSDGKSIIFMLESDASSSCMKSIRWNVNETITGRRILMLSFHEREHGFVSFFMRF